MNYKESREGTDIKESQQQLIMGLPVSVQKDAANTRYDWWPQVKYVQHTCKSSIP